MSNADVVQVKDCGFQAAG